MNIEEAYTLAVRYMQENAWQKAVEVYAGILKASPMHFDALRDMALLQFRLPEHIRKGNPFIDLLLQHYPGNAEAVFLGGILRQSEGDQTLANAAFEKALTLDSGHSGSYSALLKQALSLQDKAISPLFLSTPPPHLSRLQIEITTWCNLKCAGCPRTIDIAAGKWNNVHMPLERFEKILSHMPPSYTLCLQGVGESTLHPDFLEMIRITKATGKFTNININSNTLAKPISFYEKLKDEGLNSISVSVDSFDPDIAEACRSGTNVDKLKKRVQELMALYTLESFVVTIVVSKRNLADVQNTLRTLSGFGKLLVEIQTLIVYDPEKGADGNSPYALTQEDQEHLTNLLSDRTEYPNLSFISSLLTRERPLFRCARPFTAPFITVEGFITPCCTTYDPALLGHANVAEKPLSELWRTPAVQNWLTSYAKDSHPICKDCCFFTG